MRLNVSGRQAIAHDVAATVKPNRSCTSNGVTMKPPMYAKLAPNCAISDALKSRAAKNWSGRRGLAARRSTRTNRTSIGGAKANSATVTGWL